MEDGDVFASTHRAHGHTLARGTHPNEVMAELYGKIEGCSHGYGGSMHLYDVERGNLGANAVVGGGLPGDHRAPRSRSSCAASLASRSRSSATGRRTSACSTRRSTSRQLWKVPAVFVLENNHWAESTPASQQLPIKDLEKRAVAFGMHSMKVDGQDVEAVLQGREARARVRAQRQGAGLPGLRDLPARRSLRRRRAGLPAEGRAAGAARDAGPDHEAAREARASPTTSSRRLDREALEIAEASVAVREGRAPTRSPRTP